MIDPHEILSKAHSLKNWLLQHRKYLHMHPELSFKEYETQKYLQQALSDIGFSDINPLADTGLSTTCNGNSKGPCVALRADMDALPLQEKKHSLASVNPGIMHACGHDVHMTCLLGALKILYEIRPQFTGKVLAIFQPGEEKLPGGAIKVIKSGIFEKHNPEIIIGQHVMPGQPVGKFGFRPGNYMASTDEIYITIKGNSGHIAVPSMTQDVVSAASESIINIKKEIESQAGDVPVVIGFGKINANGNTNIMPPEVCISGTFRTMDENFRKHAKIQMKDILKQISNNYGTSFDLNIVEGYPALTNHPAYTKEAMQYTGELLGKSNIIELDKRMTGEDFAHYAQIMPAIFLRLGIAGNKSGYANVHSADFDIDNDALTYGSAVLAWLALKFIKRF